MHQLATPLIARTADLKIANAEEQTEDGDVRYTVAYVE